MTRVVLVALTFAITATGCVTEEARKKANGYYQEGMSFLEADRQKAFLSFQKSVSYNPNHRDAHYSLGHLYAMQRKLKEAEAEFLQALRIDPEYAEAENYLGYVYQEQDRWPDAVAAYRRALSNPLYATPDKAWFNLGVALAHEGDRDGAVRAFEDALRVSPPTIPPVLVNLELGRTYFKLGERTKSREVLVRVVEQNKGGPYAAEAEKLLERMTP